MPDMKISRTKRNLVAVALLLLAATLAIIVQTRPRPAPSPEQLTDITDIETLRAQFNRDAGRTRLILLLSPT